MNKIVIFVIVTLLQTGCKPSKYNKLYSNTNHNYISDDAAFGENLEKKNEKLFKAIHRFQIAINTRDIDSVYIVRTDLYKSVVSLDIFKNKIIEGSDFPNKAYFADSGSQINEKEAMIKSYYIVKKSSLEYCIESMDHWILADDEIWRFVGNNLAWGTPMDAPGPK
ncbi:MAG: hypothetical protein ABI600_14145 [Luteolibacter sp.]